MIRSGGIRIQSDIVRDIALLQMMKGRKGAAKHLPSMHTYKCLTLIESHGATTILSTSLALLSKH